VAAVRLAVRRALIDLANGADEGCAGDNRGLVLVAASGGPDSTALAATTAFEAPRAGLRAGLVTVDHGWAPGSRERAADVAALGRRLGLEPVEVLDAPAPRREGPAREVRRSALLAAAARAGAVSLLLGHSLDDQAETVLLRLARGSGSRSLAGMPAADGLIRRPLLGLRRRDLRACCEALGLPVWDDPANADPAFLRSRVRTELLPVLTEVLGPGAIPALARSAALLRADADGLDAAAAAIHSRADPLAIRTLVGLEPAVRTRVLRRAAIAGGCPPTDLSAEHVAEMDRLVTRWHGQGPLTLPGGVAARRRDGRIEFVPGNAAAAKEGPPHG
jgi:tRNA(Ile)-lysidine synthase